jgi:4a-hydroxytetrahydrobiopterin dehydratase
MADRRRLAQEEIDRSVTELAGWAQSGDRLTRTFTFADFSEAIGFMVRVALVCDKLDHHPNWSNVYNRVEVELWTHDVGGITALDVELARAMNRIAGRAEAR